MSQKILKLSSNKYAKLIGSFLAFNKLRRIISDVSKIETLGDLFVPVFGCLVLGWDSIFLYFFMDILVTVIFTSLKIILASDYTSFGTRFARATKFTFVLIFLNGFYSIFVAILSMLFFNSSLFLYAFDILDKYQAEDSLPELFERFVLPDLMDFFITVVIINTILFVMNYIIRGGYKKFETKGITYRFIQRRIIILHISTIAIAFIVGIPRSLLNAFAILMYQLTGSTFIATILVRFSNAAAALVIGLISLWNKYRMRKISI